MRIPVCLLLCLAAATSFAEDSTARVTSYPHAFFARVQPYSAFDMLAVLPGYTFSEGDADVRGFAGAGGNVLIDGSRPASKQEALETLLRRIPAATVERIEVIRAGAPGVDMQGQAVLANVVRVRGAQSRGSAEAAVGMFQRGYAAPRVAGEFLRESGALRYELSGALYRTWDDEHGVGDRSRVAPDGTTIRDTGYRQYEGSKIAELAGALEGPLAGGTLRANVAWQRERFGADIVETEVFPEPGGEAGAEFKDDRSSEIGLRYDRQFGERFALETFAIRRDGDDDEGERERDLASGDSSLFRDLATTSETILRGTLRRTGGRWTLEGSLEGAVNVLDSHTALTENEVPVPLPTAAVRVEERRGEGSLLAVWRPSPAWTLEAGSRFERSKLSQSGDHALTKTFFYPKPRALLSWSATGHDRLRLLVERDVGQLDFGDFTSSASLSAGTVTAGNPDLEPDKTWRVELTWERHFMEGAGALVLSARHEVIDDLVDRIPVAGPDGTFDAVGNIGSGSRNELELGLDLPLDRLHVAGGLVKVTSVWRRSRATDPATGVSRRISEDEPLEAAAHFSQQLPFWKSRWGVDVTLASEETEYRYDEVKTDSLGPRLDVFLEMRPASGWYLRLYAKNLTDRAAARRREIHTGMRGSAPLDYIETRTLRIGPYVEFTVRKSFGG
ncbi:MAG: TonB-dependent receptor plug domain-containing protein [Steroidobacteraceae bacterium]